MFCKVYLCFHVGNALINYLIPIAANKHLLLRCLRLIQINIFHVEVQED